MDQISFDGIGDGKYRASFVLTGGRDYKNKRKVKQIYEKMLKGRKVAVGDCPTGLDALVREIVPEEFLKVYKADWDKYGRAAGPKRNKAMIDDNPGAIVIGFSGGVGTKNCMMTARKKLHLVFKVS